MYMLISFRQTVGFEEVLSLEYIKIDQNSIDLAAGPQGGVLIILGGVNFITHPQKKQVFFGLK